MLGFFERAQVEHLVESMKAKANCPQQGGRASPTLPNPSIMALPNTFVEGFHDVEAVKRMEYR
jgi:hypothetical protein